MSNLPVVFNFVNNQIRVITDESGDPWFVAADVCSPLGLETHVTLRRLDDDEKGRCSIPTPGGEQEATIINESGLYSLVLGCRKPEAKKFKKWVTSEVLPTLRKTGGYTIPGATNVLVKTQQKLVIAQMAAEMLRMSDTSRIRMLTVIAKEDEIQPTFLPAYVNEPEVKSLTALLHEYAIGISAVKANTILVSLGILEVKEREGKNGVKPFKSLTTAGLEYGRNETSPQNPRETQPLYFADKFSKLADMFRPCMSH